MMPNASHPLRTSSETTSTLRESRHVRRPFRHRTRRFRRSLASLGHVAGHDGSGADLHQAAGRGAVACGVALTALAMPFALLLVQVALLGPQRVAELLYINGWVGLLPWLR